jgi:hypothetical protein
MEKLRGVFDKILITIKWEKIVASITPYIPLVKNYLSNFLLRAFRISGGVYSWVIGAIVSKVLEKAVIALAKKAKKEDQENVDELNQKDYETMKKEGASVDELVKKETDILNGDRKP